MRLGASKAPPKTVRRWRPPADDLSRFWFISLGQQHVVVQLPCLNGAFGLSLRRLIGYQYAIRSYTHPQQTHWALNAIRQFVHQAVNLRSPVE